MYRSDASGRLLVVNPALVAMLGYDSVEEVLELDLLKDVYINAKERAPVIESYRSSGFVEGRNVHWKTRTGRVLTVQLFGHVVETKDGLVFDATVIDLTEVDALEDELRNQREILDAVLRQMTAVYWIVDRDLRFVRNGGDIERLFGYPAQRWIGHTLQEAIAADPSSADTVDSHQRALAGETVQRESEYRGKVI